MRRLAAILAVTLALAGCGAPDADRGASDTAGANGTNDTDAGGVPGFGQRYVPQECREIPARIDDLEWLPDELAMPEGAYPVLDYGEQSGFQRAVFAAPIDYLDFPPFTVEEWGRAGWVLARAENEVGEAESAFVRGTQVGAFRARQAYCDESWSEILLTLGQPEQE